MLPIRGNSILFSLPSKGLERNNVLTFSHRGSSSSTNGIFSICWYLTRGRAYWYQEKRISSKKLNWEYNSWNLFMVKTNQAEAKKISFFFTLHGGKHKANIGNFYPKKRKKNVFGVALYPLLFLVFSRLCYTIYCSNTLIPLQR